MTRKAARMLHIPARFAASARLTTAIIAPLRRPLATLTTMIAKTMEREVRSRNRTRSISVQDQQRQERSGQGTGLSGCKGRADHPDAFLPRGPQSFAEPTGELLNVRALQSQ